MFETINFFFPFFLVLFSNQPPPPPLSNLLTDESPARLIRTGKLKPLNFIKYKETNNAKTI